MQQTQTKVKRVSITYNKREEFLEVYSLPDAQQSRGGQRAKLHIVTV
ncbi:MAG: hypothetical protein IJ711_09590 [Lachnospiraceae bacterium]|nr:hypothetical protein [Lachnospiraceae bacterium]